MSAQTGTFGIAYTPSSVSSRNKASQLNPQLLDDLHIEWVRLCWLDYANVLRFYFLSRSYFSHLLETARPGILLGAANLAAVHLNVIDELMFVQYVYAFDLSTFRVCPYAPGHATVMGFFEPTTPPPSAGPTPVPQCPRGILHRLVNEARTKAGVEFVVGFETEFTLLRSTAPPVTQDVLTDYGTTSTYRITVEESKTLLDIGKNMQLAGVSVQKLHSEAAPGQVGAIVL